MVLKDLCSCLGLGSYTHRLLSISLSVRSKEQIFLIIVFGTACLDHFQKR